jgi:hypothetical protein
MFVGALAQLQEADAGELSNWAFSLLTDLGKCALSSVSLWCLAVKLISFLLSLVG